MATFDATKDHNPALVRKALEVLILMKPVADSDPEVETLWNGTGLVVPSGYLPVGMITKDDGITFGRDQDTSETMAHGEAEPVRRDITSDTASLSFTMIESRRQAMEVYHGQDLSGITTDSSGNFYFDKASRPQHRYYRVLAIAKDGDGLEASYWARWYPRAQVSENAEQAWTEGEEVRYPATLSAYRDVEVGTSMRELWGGPGLDHAAMGFPAPAGGGGGGGGGA
jgi:hypothetical protein